MPVDMKASPVGSGPESDARGSDSRIADDDQLRREAERHRRRLKQLQLEAEGLRDWAESVEAELNALKKTFWYRLFVWKR